MDPPGWFPLIVRGGGGINATFDGDTLAVRFGRSPVAAGEPTMYGLMPAGSAAWVDRPLNEAEPSVLLQQTNRNDAAGAIGVLRNNGFWKFMCRNTNAGHFEVFRSERAFMSVPTDDGPD